MDARMDRRGFLGASAAAAVGLMVGAGSFAWAEDAQDIAAPEFPFTWHKMDVDAVQESAYQGFYDLGGCARTVFNSILGTLAEEYGYPYNQIPSEMYFNGHAGFSMGSLCGCLAGASGILGLFIPTADVDAELNKLQTWYMETEFPIYEPEMELVKTVANSINCIDSVGTWMTEAGVAERSDPKRLARCAGLSADVAAKTLEILDAYYRLTDAVVGATGEHVAEEEEAK